MKEIDPKTTNRAQQFEIWKNAPNPMLVFVKKMDVTNLIKISRKKYLKFNMLLNYCIGKAAVCQKEFYLLPIGDKLMQFDKIAINTIVKNHTGEASSCDIEFTPDLNEYNLNYLKYTNQVANSCIDRDLSKECMVIGTSAIVDTELEFAGGMYSGIYNNPYIIWGRYSKHFFKYYLNISFQFHHAQMDGMHAAKFLNNLQQMIHTLRVK
ncbi:MAG: chloramphenicol acetyltransferase [Paludibacteraceae bacterium]|nr:chloramphenicol acetyltransferase [Paludibacteraceae bacterium]